jgi:hypothetical protein
LRAEQIAPPVGQIDVSHLRAHHPLLQWRTIIRRCPIFEKKKRAFDVIKLENAIKRVHEYLEDVDEPQRRSFGNSIFHPYRLQVTRPDNPERSTIDQLVDDLLDRLSTASPDTRERIEAKLERLLAEHDHLKSPDDFLQGHQQQEH